MRRRLSRELVRRRIADDEQEAASLVAAGSVLVAGTVADNPGRLVGPDEPIEILRAGRFVSRGGEKLDGALDDLGLDVGGSVVLDVGSSTGGFTDCVLQRGAKQVIAVDVGRALLHERLRRDDRVVVHEGVHVRDVATVVDLGSIDVVVADVSFISACSVIDATAGRLRQGCDLLVLVKPQFEASRADADRGSGVVTDPTVVGTAVSKVRDRATRAGLVAVAEVGSRTAGRRGNVEYFLHLRQPASF